MSENSLTYTPITQWAEDDRPREKLLLKGRSALSDAELIAILIATGTKELSAVDLAKRILALADNNLNELGKLTINDLKKVKGIGEAKAITIAAALELGRRRKTELPKEKLVFKTSAKAYEYLSSFVADLAHEEFWLLLLKRDNSLIKPIKLSVGGVHATVVDVKLVAKYALENLASAIILCHNHPSGAIQPSEQDRKITQQIKQALKLLEINLIDHIIVGQQAYYSFADNGEI